MPTSAFGFSVGDLVAVTTLIWKLYKALSDASEGSKIFHDVQVELFAFNGIIIQLQQSIRNGGALPEEEWLVVQKTLEQIKATVEEFGRYIDTFKAGHPNKEGTQKFVSWKKWVVFNVLEGKKVKRFRESMQSYSTILTLALQSFNNLAVQNLDQHLTTEARDLNLQLQRNTDDLRSHITRTIEEPWDQKPIRFQDAMGRIYPLPLEVCRTLEGLLDFLKHSFKGTQILDTIKQGSIWLFSPAPGQRKVWNLITAEDWELHAHSGMQLGMSISTTGFNGSLLREAVPVTSIEAAVSFKTPLPHWAPYPEDAEFKYLSPTKEQSLPPNMIQQRPSHPMKNLLGCSMHAMAEAKGKHERADSPPALYWCRNTNICLKHFATEEERSQHLEVTVFTLDQFKSFIESASKRAASSRHIINDSCLWCGMCRGWEQEDYEREFRDGCEVQMALTPEIPRKGLSICVAEKFKVNRRRGCLDCGRFS